VAVAAAFRPGPSLTTPLAATRLALKSLAGRYQQLNAEIAILDERLSQPPDQVRLLEQLARIIHGAPESLPVAVLRAARPQPVVPSEAGE
jgi:hypothetical protein